MCLAPSSYNGGAFLVRTRWGWKVLCVIGPCRRMRSFATSSGLEKSKFASSCKSPWPCEGLRLLAHGWVRRDIACADSCASGHDYDVCPKGEHRAKTARNGSTIYAQVGQRGQMGSVKIWGKTRTTPSARGQMLRPRFYSERVDCSCAGKFHFNEISIEQKQVCAWFALGFPWVLFASTRGFPPPLRHAFAILTDDV